MQSSITGLTPPVVTPEALSQCTEILEAIAQNQLLLSPLTEAERVRLLVAAGRVVRPEKHDINRRIKALRKIKKKRIELRDRALRSVTQIRAARQDSLFVAPERTTAPESEGLLLERPRDCYICKKEFNRLHFFYDAMCPSCAQFNYEKRFQSASLEGKTAVITGARLKIGYQAALMMLRAGARVVVTTRFPQDAAVRYAREKDFADWGDRLQIHGLDLRHTPSVEVFTRYLGQALDRLDVLINNAAQTVRRPPGFYAHLLELEKTPHSALPPGARQLLAGHERCKAALSGAPGQEGSTWLSQWHEGSVIRKASLGLTASAELSQVPYACDETNEAKDLFPSGKLDADLQQIDLRGINSWRLTLADVPTAELLEVQLVNSIAPFVLCAKLKPLMLRTPNRDKHIVNVSAVEGQFNRHTKTDKHPHTNMAKAALNMMTLTSAREYVKSGIHMNAVDTGWVTDEDPAALSARKQQDHDFQPPLDIVDGAARVCDPFFSGLITGNHSWGCFLKDYAPTGW